MFLSNTLPESEDFKEMASDDNTNAPATSKELLQITGDGSRSAVVESLFRKQTGPLGGNKPKTFKVARSPLFDHLQTFLPKLESANQKIPKDIEKIKDLDIENTDGCEKVIEMNLLMGTTFPSDSENEESTSETDSDSDSDSSSNMHSCVTEKTLKFPSDVVSGKRRGQSLIKDLSSEDGEKSESESTEASSGSGERSREQVQAHAPPGGDEEVEAHAPPGGDEDVNGLWRNKTER